MIVKLLSFSTLERHQRLHQKSKMKKYNFDVAPDDNLRCGCYLNF